MKRGYILYWRKMDDCKVLQEPGKRYSKKEAWIHLVAYEAQGVPRNGLHRGEFEVSYRYLAKKWNWSKSSVERFMKDLQDGSDPMIKRLGQSAGHLVGQSAGHFIICKYDDYNKPWDSQRDTSRDTSRDKLNNVLNKGKEGEKDTCPPKADASVLFDIFASENKKLPQVKTLTPDRRAKCRSRINQAERTGCLEQYLKDFRDAVAKAQQVPFLYGESGGWRASFDWFIANDKNVYGVLEGKYDSSINHKKNQDTVGLYEGPDDDAAKPPEYWEAVRRRAEALGF